MYTHGMRKVKGLYFKLLLLSCIESSIHRIPDVEIDPENKATNERIHVCSLKSPQNLSESRSISVRTITLAPNGAVRESGFGRGAFDRPTTTERLSPECFSAFAGRRARLLAMGS